MSHRPVALPPFTVAVYGDWPSEATARAAQDRLVRAMTDRGTVVVDRRGSDTGPIHGTGARDLKVELERARRAAGERGSHDVLHLPGARDPIPGDWAPHVARLTPGGCFRVDLAELAAALGRTRNSVARELSSTDPAALAELLRSRRLVLVEGVTDRAVLDVLLHRSGISGLSVVPAGSKVRLAGLTALARQLSIPTYVVFDGDGGALPAATSKAHRVQRSRQQQTEALLDVLTPATHPTDWSFGDPTTAGPHWCAWKTTLEGELSTWAGFMSAARSGTGTSSDPYNLPKREALLREATLRADLVDLPGSFRHLLQRLVAFTEA